MNSQFTDEAFNQAQGSNSLINKIRALFRLADPKRGATPEEAKTALAKAQELMTRHGIQMACVGNADEQHAQPSWDFQKETYKTGRQRYEQDRYIYWILEKCFGVKVYFSSYGEYVETKRKSKYGRTGLGDSSKTYVKRHAFVLVGDTMDVEVAKMAIDFLHPTMRRSYLDFCKATGTKFNVSDANRHYEGIMDGYVKASEQGQELARSQAKKKDADAYSIVLVDKKNALAAFAKKNVKATSGTRARCTNGSAAAYDSGYRTGKNLDINTGRRIA